MVLYKAILALFLTVILCGCMTLAESTVSSDTPKCMPGAPSLHGGSQSCNFGYFFSADSAPYGHPGRLTAGPLDGVKEWYADALPVPAKGRYGNWECAGRAITGDAKYIKVIRVSQPGGVPGNDGYARWDGVIEVRDSIPNPYAMAWIVDQERDHMAGCVHLQGPHTPFPRGSNPT